MAQDKVSYRYARAIFDYVKDGATLRSLIAELKEFAQIVSTHSELSLVLTGDIYSTEDRHAILKDLFLKKLFQKLLSEFLWFCPLRNDWVYLLLWQRDSS